MQANKLQRRLEPHICDLHLSMPKVLPSLLNYGLANKYHFVVPLVGVQSL